jgi:signal transduction histidine kinase/ActR/RegA family two-component response regulator
LTAESGVGKRQLTFERLLFDLSTQFVVVRLNAEELAAAISDALGQVNDWLGVAGSALGRVELDSSSSTVLFSTPEASPALHNLLIDESASELVASGNDLSVSRHDDGAVGRGLVENELDGLLILPLSAEDNRVTYLACWWGQPLSIGETEARQLRMLGELALAALQRHDAETRQAELEAKLRQGSKLQSLGLLAGGVAHDFNNILTVIRGCAEVALLGRATKRPIEEYLTQIISAADQASAMARKLLAFGRQGVTVGNSVAVNEVVNDLKPLLLRLLRGNIQVSLDLTEEACVVATTASDVEQIVMNLCVNSGEAMRDGGELSIRTRRVERQPPTDTHSRSYVEICVRDAGAGMTAQQVATIFDPFFTTKAFGEGAGLGLSVVHGIVMQLEGFVEVDSTPGAGTEMRIYLPAVTARPSRPSVSAARNAVGGNQTVLLVDDLPGICLVMSSTLEAAGYKTLSAHDANEAFELFDEHRDEVALVVLDLIMPTLGGREVYDRLALEEPGLPVLFVSGYTAHTLPRSYLERPQAELLPKPFTGDQLLAAVRRVLGSTSRAVVTHADA